MRLPCWDIRFATGEKPKPDLPDPLAALPNCPPGMLQNEEGLPLKPEDQRSQMADGEWDYPIEIPWDGILVDDLGHALDIEARVRRTLDIISPGRAEEIEREACAIFEVNSLRDYFRKTTGFFADHLKRYSKSRRKAPIYWSLSTASGSYTIWLYYHRLTDQTPYTIVNKYLEPKIEDVQRAAARIEDELAEASGTIAATARDALNDLRAFAQELAEMKQELLRVAALPYRPDLNDGVIINAAPLYKLFRHRGWASECEEVWKKLENEQYEWSHMAGNIWPRRVRDKCKTDRSLAIAHGLEDICEVPPPGAKKRNARRGGAS